MAMDFPAGPTVGQIVSLGGNQYIWDGTAWNIVPQQAPAAMSDLPPANPAVGQFWWRGTNGQLYVYVNDGNSSQWVQAAGSQGAPGLWETIPNVAGSPIHTLSAVANYDVTGLAAYQKFRINGALACTAAAQVGIRCSSNNGVSYDAGASDYSYQVCTFNTTNAIPSSAASTMLLLAGSGSDVGSVLTFQILMERFNKAVSSDGNAQTKTRVSGSIGGYLLFLADNIVAARDAIRIVCASGTLTGTFTLEGVRG